MFARCFFFLQRIPQGAVATYWPSLRGNITVQSLGMILGLHVRLGNEDNIWGANRERATTLQQFKNCVELCKPTAAEARDIMKLVSGTTASTRP